MNTDEGYLYAVDPRTATVQWQTSAPTIGLVTETRVYSYSDATLWAYDLSTGTEQWEHVLPDSKYGSIQFINDTLYVSVGEFQDQGLVAVDPATGTESWYYRPGDVETFLIDDQGLYVTEFSSDDRDEQIARIDDRTGAEQWSFTCKSRPSSYSVKVDDQSLFVREYLNGTAAAIDRVSGRLNWRSEEYSDCEGIWIGESALYVDGEGAYDDEFENKFHAVDLQTGRTKWEVETDGDVYSSDMDSVPDDIYIGTYQLSQEGGTAYCVSERTGRVQWQYTLGESVQRMYSEADPVVVETAPDDCYKIYGIDEGSGDPVWSLAGEEHASVTLATDERIVVSLDDETHILRRADGSTETQCEADATASGGGALFVRQDGDVSAYPVASDPRAFQETSGQQSGTSTQVFSADSAPADDPAESSDTNVFQGGSADSESASLRDSPQVAFCPSCGTDLSEFSDTQYCPSCGTELPN